MTKDKVCDAISKGLGQVAPEADLSTLSPSENVREALDIDSYDFLNFLIRLSEDLGVEIPEADYAKLATLQSMTDYLLAHAR